MRIFLNIIFLTAVVLTTGCNKIPKDGSNYVVFSDLEETTLVGNKKFKSNYSDFLLGNAEYATTEFALSGKQSIKLNENQQYGLSVDLENIREGQFIRASVWQKEGALDGTLIASVEGKGYKNFYRTFYDKEARTEKGWTLHYLTFVVTKGAEKALIYIFSGSKEAYFDDIKIEVLQQAPGNNLAKKLDLVIPVDSQNDLNEYISDALQAQVIADKNKKYVKASVVLEGDTTKVKMKLKGDWTDHLKSGKTSYRIKMKGNNAFEGLKSFSIQHPRTRNYVHEWILHEIADGEDVLSTKYDFINVSINGASFGVYALEEHFDKQLLEQRKRREGPILKLDESGAWAFNYNKDIYKNWKLLPYFKASHISVFKEGRTLANSRLKKNFEEGRSLLNRFKNGDIKPEDAFDIDLLARFYAVNELSSHNHALAWHNRRFYFNPVTQKLEPILFDVIPHSRPNDFDNNIELRLTAKPALEETVFDNFILLNKAFKERYMAHLTRLTSADYLDSTFAKLGPQLNTYIEAIKGEDLSYKFDQSEYFRNAEYLRSRMPVLDSLWESALLKPTDSHDWVLSKVYKPIVDSFFVKEVSVNAYVKKQDSSTFQLQMENFHNNPVTVVGYEREDLENGFVYFEKPLTLSAFKDSTVMQFETVYFKPKKILIQPDNLNGKTIEKRVFPWANPSKTTTRETLANDFQKQKGKLRISNNTITLSRDITIDQLIYVPENYKVEILAGATILFKNGGGLVINNSVSAIGTENAPINIICKDSSSNGFTVLNAKGGVTFKYINFDGLSHLNYGNWELTGAVNIYESPTNFSYVNIRNNTSEDALNIIRSHFKIDNLTIENTTSDGFDADFCTGTITNSHFINTGNDCIDFSGSEVDITDVKIVNSGDKGISGGEGSTLTIENIDVNGAITGVASKDRSVITGSNVTVTKSEYGFGAFQKKGEYAPAKIILENSQWTEVDVETLIDKGSSISLNGKEETGTVKIDVDKLYERFGPK